MADKMMTVLVFDGQAEAALAFYTSLFTDASISFIKKYSAEGPGQEGAVMQAQFNLAGTNYLCMDLVQSGPLPYTRAISLSVQCTSHEELQHLFSQLSEGGHVWMAPASYGSSQEFSWVRDRFGISWQLHVPFLPEDPGDGNLCFANSREVRPEYRE